MAQLVRVLLACAVSLCAGPAFAGDVCVLLSRADAAGLLGQPVVAVSPAGPAPDEDSGGRLSYCTWRAAGAAAVLSIVEFGSAAEAAKQLNEHWVTSRMDADDGKVAAEGGIGDKAYWAVSSEAASYTFLKGARVVQIGVGGAADAQRPKERKDALRTLAQSLAKKL